MFDNIRVKLSTDSYYNTLICLYTFQGSLNIFDVFSLERKKINFIILLLLVRRIKMKESVF